MDKKSEQWMRKLKFISELKKNNYPTAETFAKKLCMFEDEDGQPFGCSARTVARDIRELVEVHKAPLEYDPHSCGYYLSDPSWNLDCPVFEDDFVSMAVLGTRLAADILPDPVKKSVDDAISITLANECSDFFDSAMIDTILCASGIKASIDPATFEKLFEAWRRQQMVILTYKNPKGEVSEHKFEPHLIAFHKGAWYAKGYKYGTKDVRLYAVQRIVGLHNGGDCFEPDKKLLEDTRKKGLFNYEKVSGIKLHCDASIALYIYEQQKVFKSRIGRQADDSLIVNLNPAIEHEVIRWILAEAGRIQVLDLKSLRKKIAEAGRNIMESNC
ncbi:MAG: WYL domain-containing protein [Victivallaceae bacterium]|nr:WYL domain-containing protein [Victivallaceae bacterium]